MLVCSKFRGILVNALDCFASLSSRESTVLMITLPVFCPLVYYTASHVSFLLKSGGEGQEGLADREQRIA